MNLRTTFNTIALIATLTSHAQTILREGTVAWYETRKSTNKMGKPITRTTLRSVSFSPQTLRVVIFLKKKVVTTNITNCGQDPSTFFVTNGEAWYQFDDIRNDNFLEMGAYKNAPTTITYTGETAVFGQYNCKKAIMTTNIDGQPDTLQVWYTPDYKIDPSCFNWFFDKIEGLPVSVIYPEHSTITIGDKLPPATIELLLNDVHVTTGQRLDTIANQQKYTRISDQQEKTQKLVSLLFGPHSNATPKGTPISDTFRSANGASSLVITRYNPFTVGTTFPQFTTTQLNNDSLSLTALQNKPFVLNFWFTKCGPCIDEMPLLNKVAASYAGRNIAFLSMTYDNPTTVQTFIKQHPFNFTHLVNAQTTISQLGIFSYPTTVVVDSKGIIRFVKVGGFTSETELTQAISQVL